MTDSPKGRGVFLVQSDWSSGSLVFYEKAVGRTATGDVLTIGTAAVKVGNTSQDVDLQWYGTGSVSAIFDCGDSSFTLVGVNMATNAPVVITDTTESTSTSTGALIVSGGIANAKDCYFGDDVFLTSAAKLDWAAGNVTLTHSTGKLTNSGALTNTGAVNIDDTTDSTSTTTGSLQTDGGLGVAKDIYAGDDIFMVADGVINWGAGDVTLTGGTNLLTLGGGGLSVGASGAGFDVIFYGETVGCDFFWDQNGDTDGSLILGADTTGVDFKAFGATTGNYLLWDKSADDLLLVGTATQLAVAGTTESTSTTTGSLRTAGGLACVGDFYAGDDIFLTTGAVLNFNAGEVTITHSTGALAGVAAAGFTFTSATLNATTGRVGKFVGTVAAPSHADGYGAFEIDITASGVIEGPYATASSTWLNIASGATPGSNMVCIQNNGLYAPAGITWTNVTAVLGMRMQCVIEDGAQPGKLVLFDTNIYDNALTSLIRCNAASELTFASGAKSTNAGSIPLFYDFTANKTWYVNVYDG